MTTPSPLAPPAGVHGSEPPANGASRLGQVISGRYLIKELIGEGGMGSVYLAEHTHMRKRVALKLLHAEMSNNEEVLARFRREAEAAAHIEHPNVVAATDFGHTGDGGFFLVLEYVEGTSLRDALRAGSMPVARALHITRQIAFALERAHDAGIVHRDLKPENVMLVRKEDDPDFVKVLDFGIARFEAHAQRDASQQPLTRLGTILGTPEYMAPEQALGETVTAVSDLYAVGVMLYEMLTGQHPFEADDRMAILSMHLVAPVPPMRDRAPSVQIPPAVEGIVRRLLEKDGKARFPNGRALSEAIEEAAAVSGIALPILASPHSRESIPRIPMPTSSQRMLAAPPSGPVSAAQWSDNDDLA
jgi:eukaryotic-like serine/threonine-protein kinase